MKIFFAAILASFTFTASGEEITVAAASNFTAAMNAVAATFERDSGHEINVAFGSSGSLYAQIANGAPYQVFFSADRERPRVLEENDLAVPGSRFTYAIGRLVLWSADSGYVDADGAVLRGGDFSRLTLANPELAPYGAAAVQVLENLGLIEATRGQWVRGSNIAQTYQFVFSGNAELGFVALSQIMERGDINDGSAWIVPSALHDPIRQDAVLLARGNASPAARELLEFVRGDRGRALIESFGYETP